MTRQCSFGFGADNRESCRRCPPVVLHFMQSDVEAFPTLTAVRCGFGVFVAGSYEGIRAALLGSIRAASIALNCNSSMTTLRNGSVPRDQRPTALAAASIQLPKFK